MKYFLALTLLVTACAPTRFVQPLPKDHYAATASLGGPLITFSDITIPMPLTSLAGGYGLSKETTVFGGLHTTALAFKDVQLDLGAVHQVTEQHGFIPSTSVSLVANTVLAMRDGAFRIWPEIDVNAYWDYRGKGDLLYVSMNNWYEFSKTRANGAPRDLDWLKNFALGHIFDGEHWQYTAEIKYLLVGQPNQPNPVDYHGISGYGTLGVYLALTRKF